MGQLKSRTNATVESHQCVKFFRFASGQLELVTEFPRGTWFSHGFAASPDGRWILYATVDQSESDIMLVPIARKRLSLEASLYQILQVLSVTLFEKVPILRALQASHSQHDLPHPANLLMLFDF